MRIWWIAIVVLVACDKGSGGGASSWATGAPGAAPAAGTPSAAAPAPAAPSATPPGAPAAAAPAAAEIVPVPAAPGLAPTAPAAAPSWKQGDRVQGQWSDGRWYNGKIGAVNDDGTFDIAYDDGDHAKHLAGKHVRTRRTAAATGGSTSSSGNAPCPGPGLTRRCGGVCVNIQEDNNNCGSCGNRCPSGKHCDGHMFCRDANGEL